jgi:hypothetical protein
MGRIDFHPAQRQVFNPCRSVGKRYFAIHRPPFLKDDTGLGQEQVVGVSIHDLLF